MNKSCNESIQRVVSAAKDSLLGEQIGRAIIAEGSVLKNPARCVDRLARFVEGSRVPSTLLSQWERDPDLLRTLLQTLDVDSPAVEWLIDDTDCFDELRLMAGQVVRAESLRDRLLAELRCLDDQSQMRSALRRFRRREILRVLFGWSLHGMTSVQAEVELAYISEAILHGAFDCVLRTVDGTEPPIDPSATPVAVLAVGALGARAMDFTSPCELLCIYSPSTRRSRTLENRWQDPEGWHRRMHHFKELLQSFDPETFAVSFPSLWSFPGQPSALLHDSKRWLEMAGPHGHASLWAALLKARPIVGNSELAQGFLHQVHCLTFERYRTRSEIASLSTLLRRRNRMARNACPTSDPWTSAMVEVQRAECQFDTILVLLQLLHGSENVGIRSPDARTALNALAQTACLSADEFQLLSETQDLARDGKFALQIQSGCVGRPSNASRPVSELGWDANRFEALRAASTHLQRLADDLRDRFLCDEGECCDEAELILDPNPDLEWARELLKRFHFQDLPRALSLVQGLAVEDFQVLSTRRCRYYLSTIAGRLLERIGQTPSPDLTLENLAATCRSIGAKGVLWELFRLHQPSMDLYVRLCGTSPYLVGILTSNPGMVDELLDSLMFGRLPVEGQLSAMLDELCRGAQDVDAIVQSFKNAMHLTVGVRDILGKENISETHRTLANVADVCLQQLVEHHYNSLVQRSGVPTLDDGSDCRFALLAVGKLGSREPNYHSDVTVLFLHEGLGFTRPMGPMRHHQSISNDFFFHQLAQRFAQGVNRLTRFGRLFELQNWIFSKERTANLAWSLQAFEDYFLGAADDALIRLQLSTARTIAGDPSFQRRAQEVIHHILQARPWTVDDTQTVLRHRAALEKTASPRNLKRGCGGTLDIESLAQVLSLQQANMETYTVVPGTIDSLENLRRCGAIQADDGLELKDAYNFLRGVESGLRLMNTKARHDLPSDPLELSRLAYGLHIPDSDQLVEACDHYRALARRLLMHYLGAPAALHR